MQFWEAMKAYSQGKTVRCKKWDQYHRMNKYRDNTSISDRQEFWLTINEDWELFEEPEQLLNFSQVVEGLKQGKKFRRKCWERICYINLSDMIRDQAGEALFLSRDSFEATDWIQVE